MLPDFNPVGGNKYLFLIGYIISDMILISNKIYKIRILQIWGMETEYHKTLGMHNDKVSYNSQNKKEGVPLMLFHLLISKLPTISATIIQIWVRYYITK